MTYRTISRFFVASLLLGATPLLASCGETDSPVGSYRDAIDGQTCDENGATGRAKDGCNTCSCSDGRWACTDKACTECEPGNTKRADDGCNSCECTAAGTWACTDASCETPPTDCTPGASKPADDGCNTCHCSPDGDWECTLVACVDCVPGQIKDDGCNTCECAADATWVCTDRACPTCPAAREPGPEVVCLAAETWAKDPVSGMCCGYSDSCGPQEDWPTFFSEAACRGLEER